MLAMQYSFTLPGDYDMAIIDDRIREKGHLIDGFPHLVFKAYLSAKKSSTTEAAPENLYAPFYVWDSPDGMNQFISSAGFGGLVQSFGWPVVRNWSTLCVEVSDEIKSASFATREVITVPPFTDIAALRAQEEDLARAAVRDGTVLAQVVALNPQDWTLVRFRLLRSADAVEPHFAGDCYDVGYVSYSAA